MTNLEARPEVHDSADDARPPPAAVEVVPAREVPLGGPRAMTVRRTLPSRTRTSVGGWCFADHYGPDDVTVTGGMSVAPHPHTGLQTVSWLFSGEIEHRDSAGHTATVRPGELNLMTAGRGISHSEVSTPATRTLHGVQLWVALPSAVRTVEPGFERHLPDPVRREGCTVRVFLGSLFDITSPVTTYSPLTGAELVLDAGATVEVEVDGRHEHGVLVDQGPLAVGGQVVEPHELAYLRPGTRTIELRTDTAARVLLLGGAPLEEQIVMWWNFVGRDHDEIVRFREQWQAQVADGTQCNGPFGVTGGTLPPLPAPDLPHVRLRPR